MSDDERSPYAPPASSVEVAAEPEAQPQRGAPLKAVGWGVVAGVGGPLLAAIPIGLLYGALSAFVSEELADIFLAVASEAVHYLFAAAGGYICARQVRAQEWRWGALTAVLVALLVLFVSDGAMEAVTQVIMCAAAALAGVGVGAQLNRRDERARVT